MTSGDTLILVGGGLEVAGVLLVVIEIRNDLRSARTITPTEHRRVLGAAREADEALPITPKGGREPTLEERVRELERQLLNVEQTLGNRIATVQSDVEKLDAETVATWNEVQKLSESLRQFLGGMLRGGLRSRIAGVTLIVIGIALSVAGTVITN